MIKLMCTLTSLLSSVVLLCACSESGEITAEGEVAANIAPASADSATVLASGGKAQPNIILILADDMGYGDIGAYNPDSKVPTPNLDRLAAQGIRFTDAHAPAAVCSPSRYALLTGRYAWRSRLKSGVLWGYSPLLIEKDRVTIASLLQQQGYATAGIGKWHLGMGRSEADFFGAAATAAKETGGDSGRLRPGPNEVGFDYFFGIPASLDMRPYVYVEDGRPYTPLTGKLVEASGSRRHGGGGFWRKGQVAEGFVHEAVLPTLTEKALGYIRARGAAGSDQPFFLYFSLTAPHTPWLPTDAFRGKSGAGYYGDFAVQVDAVVGQVSAELEKQGMTDSTLLIFTSDNGAHWLETDIQEFGHHANGRLRGQKADIHEGGHRVPFIVRWPGQMPAGRVSSQPTTFTDLLATLAMLTGAELPQDAGEDSFNILPALFGQPLERERAPMVHHSGDGMFAIRDGNWKLIEGLGSGGFTRPKRKAPMKGMPDYQLYNLESDPGESRNVAADHPDIIARLATILERFRSRGRSR